MNLPGAARVSVALGDTLDYQQSLLYCRGITRAAKSTFPIAFRFLPPAKRCAMEALYAFLRVSDDLADGAGDLAAKKLNLRSWRIGLHAALDGRFSHPVHPALIETIRKYSIPPLLLFDALDGVESDLGTIRFPSFQNLYDYCYRVASTVGLACIHIWGCRAAATPADLRQAEDAAEAAGIAFQLTNILRDLKEDFQRGRTYLPLDDLLRFGVSPDNRGAAGDSNLRELILFQAARARSYYRQAEPLDRLLSTDGRAIFQVMMGMYRRLLTEIEHDVAAIFSRRISIPSWRKVLILLDGLAVKWGWK